MITAALVLSTILSTPVPPIPPDLPIPDELEICILQAELCAAKEYQPQCGWMNFYALEMCTTLYEDCAWEIEEMHEIGCRQSHATCALEAPLYPNELWYQHFCEGVNKVCPSY